MLKRFSIGFGLFALAAIPAFCQNNALTKAEKSEGWVSLFDGKTMKNWVDPRQKTPPGDAWTIEDGCLKTHARPQITEDLFSQDTYRDFELAFEWRIAPGGNSGVKYRIQDHLFVHHTNPGERFESSVERSYLDRVQGRPAKGQDYVVGFEYQMTDDGTNRDALSNPKHTAGALYDMVAPSSAAAKPAGEFNQSRIVLRGNHVEHWLNGVKVVDSAIDSADAMAGIQKRWGTMAPHVYELMSKQARKDCPISLQNHGDEAWFRNIKIKRL
jgi:hypothetical protein